MVLNTGEKNDKEAWEAYNQEFDILKEKALEKQAAIDEKYKEINAKRVRGLDGDPSSREHKELMHWVGQEIKRLRRKYGIVE